MFTKTLTPIVVAALATVSSALSGTAAPLKVYILAGQSNMQGHAHTNTFTALRLDGPTDPLVDLMLQPDGSPRTADRVWISSIGSSTEEKTGPLTIGYGAEKRGPKLGPEYSFGLRIQELVDGPILLIKTAWGGKSLYQDFRPPSAGPYAFNEAQLKQMESKGVDMEAAQRENQQKSGHFYRMMMAHIQQVLSNPARVCPEYNPDDGVELAGFVWFQGWNDMVNGGVYPNRSQPGGYDLYSQLMAQFIRDVRKDLSQPELPFVIGVMGAGGPVDAYPEAKKRRYGSTHEGFRVAMEAPAKLPEFDGTVAAVRTEAFWDMKLDALRARESELKQQVNQRVNKGTLTKQQAAGELALLKEKTFSEKELQLLKFGASNAEYHYLGSAKILGGIGKAFAEAVHELETK